MSAISIYRPELFGSGQDFNCNRLKFHRNVASCSMTTMVFKSPQTIKKEKNSIQILSPVLLPQSASDELRFDRPLPDDEELANVRKLEFDKFVVRKAVINEEIWTAAWLRAETHYENQRVGRNDEVYKKRFAEGEFEAIQNRSNGINGKACTCVVAVMNEPKHTQNLSVIKSVVGTLDVSMRQLLHGETFPTEREFTHLSIVNKEIQEKYAYVSNLCVRKSVRGQGIATNMLKYAIDTARLVDVEQLYVHVRRDNEPALALYEKFGFEEVEVASPTLLGVGKYLLCVDTQKVQLDDVDIHT